MENELTEFNQERVLEVYSSKQGLDDFVQDASSLVTGFTHDMSTGVSRARTASLARKVATYKGSLDTIGKELVKGWKDKSAVVDANRKKMRDSLDQLKIEARLPLTLWEQEQARIAQELADKEAAEQLAREKESDHEMALLMDNEANRLAEEEARLIAKKKAEDEAERIELELQQEQERQVAESLRVEAAAEAARVEAEEAAQAELDRVAEVVARAEQAAEESKLAVIRAEERAKAQEEHATKREMELKEEAAQAAERAKQAQIQAQKDEESALVAEQERLAASKAHVGKIRGAAKDDLIEAGLSEKHAKIAVLAISNRLISNISIKY